MKFAGRWEDGEVGTEEMTDMPFSNLLAGGAGWPRFYAVRHGTQRAELAFEATQWRRRNYTNVCLRTMKNKTDGRSSITRVV